MPTVSRFSRKSDPSTALRIAALAALPVLLGSIPIAALERMPAVCLLRRMGWPCWGCGMTRALAAASRGDLRRAWRYNRLSAAVLPLLAALWWKRLVREIERV